MSDPSNHEFRAWPKRYEQGGWSSKRRRKTVTKGLNHEKSFGKQRRIWSFATKVRMVALILFLVAGTGGVLAWLLMRDWTPKVVADPAVEVTPDFSETAAKEKWVGPSPRQIVDAFVAATTNEERLKWVRDPEKVGPMVAEWYSTGPGSRERVTRMIPLDPPEQDSRLNLGSAAEHTRLLAYMNDGGQRLMSVVRTPEGGKLDFECYIRKCSAPWSAILSGEVVEADVRVSVQPDAYHNFNYLDERKWRSFSLISPELDEAVYLYAPVDLPNLREMPRGWVNEPQRMLLRIKHTSRENLGRRQFELVKILSTAWTE